MIADTPESVRAMIGRMAHVSSYGVVLWGEADGVLTRYAGLLEKGDARIRELETELDNAAKRSQWHKDNHLAAEDCISKLQAQIAAHEKVCAGVWVPCSERLPDDEQYHTVTFNHGEEISAMRLGDEWHELLGESPERFDEPGEFVTHWLDVKEPRRRVRRCRTESLGG